MSSCLGYWQYQQLSGPGVSVWREHRMMLQLADLDSVLELARVASDNSDWNDYELAIGGINMLK